MEGAPEYQSGTKGKRACLREERKRRKSSGMEEGPSGQRGRGGSSSLSGASRGIIFRVVDDGGGGEGQRSRRWECFPSFVYMLLRDVTVDDPLCPAVL